MPKLILASGSPRRKELLAGLGLEFTVIPSLVSEPGYSGSDPANYAVGLARSKAAAVAQGISEGLVIGADTIVVLHGQVLGKPATAGEAVDMLTRLSAETHTVYTGLAVIDAADGRLEQVSVATDVRFHRLSPEEISAYVTSGEPFDKAGGYGIQGLGALLVHSISGCYFNVVGLPLSALDRLLKRFGFAILLKERNEDKRIR